MPVKLKHTIRISKKTILLIWYNLSLSVPAIYHPAIMLNNGIKKPANFKQIDMPL